MAGANKQMVLKFSKQQLEVLKAVAGCKSVFITGSAGTGKSYVLGFIVRFLRGQWGEECVYVTASTGLAACAVGGTTLHSFAGIGLGTDDDAETMAAKAFGKPECRDRWRRARVLIIDEISMIDGDLFDKLDYVARKLRKGVVEIDNEERCFGGIQLIVTGDFFQLPPVKPRTPHKYFAFEADCWNKCFDLQIELKHPFRQSDERLIGILNQIRTGTVTAHMLESLQTCFRVPADDGLAPTRLYPLKADVRAENMKELRALGEQVFKFAAQDSAESAVYRAMLEGMRAEKELELCVGAQVMLVKNLDTQVGFVNGARGVVVGFQSLPFKEGDVKEEVARLISPTMKWPAVRFACNGMERIMGPEKQSVECGGREVAKRMQVPLILSWALSVHKCQGLTLEKVETDLSKAFDHGMVYVALSRVKNLESLQLLGFDLTKIKVHPKVVSFYNQLSSCK